VFCFGPLMRFFDWPQDRYEWIAATIIVVIGIGAILALKAVGLPVLLVLLLALIVPRARKALAQRMRPRQKLP